MDGSQSTRCMNCGAILASNEAKLFAEVMVCGACHTVAARVHERGQAILRRLNLLLKDTLRSALKNGKVQFPMADTEVVGDQELLKRIVGLYFEQEKEWPTSKPLPPASTVSTAPSASTVDSS